MNEFEANKRLLISVPVSAELFANRSTLDPIGEPVVELEVVGSVYCYSFSQLSEVLWIHRVNSSRTQLRGLARICRTISDLFLSVSLWISWVLLSLGKLVISLLWGSECNSIILGLFLVVVACESFGLSRRFSSASQFGVSYRRGSSEEVSFRVFRHSEVDSTSSRPHGEGEAAQSEAPLQHSAPAQDGEEGDARQQEV